MLNPVRVPYRPTLCSMSCSVDTDVGGQALTLYLDTLAGRHKMHRRKCHVSDRRCGHRVCEGLAAPSLIGIRTIGPACPDTALLPLGGQSLWAGCTQKELSCKKRVWGSPCLTATRVPEQPDEVYTNLQLQSLIYKHLKPSKTVRTENLQGTGFGKMRKPDPDAGGLRRFMSPKAK